MIILDGVNTRQRQPWANAKTVRTTSCAAAATVMLGVAIAIDVIAIVTLINFTVMFLALAIIRPRQAVLPDQSDR